MSRDETPPDGTNMVAYRQNFRTELQGTAYGYEMRGPVDPGGPRRTVISATAMSARARDPFLSNL